MYQLLKFHRIGMLLTLTFLSIFTTSIAYSQEVYNPNSRSNKTKTKRITAVLPFHHKAQSLTVEMDNGRAFIEGDIAIRHAPINRLIQGAVAIASSNYRWNDGIIPYSIQSNHPKRTNILDAIDYINGNTNICIVPRSGERDYVQFVRYNLGCWSYVGRQGGMQEVNIGNCDFGAVVHEICHAIGLFHEQSRADRDNYITINWNNIEPTQRQNFDKHVSTGIDIGKYDYHSIMHYPSWAFSNTGRETISCKGHSGCPNTMGQRNQLSQGDLAGIRYLYRNASGCGNSSSPTPTKPTRTKPAPSKPKPKPRPPVTHPKPKQNIIVAITNALGDNQCSEKIQLNIGGANSQFNLSARNKQKTIEFVFPEPGWYTYSINAQTTFYKSFWGWNYTYNRKGSGQGKIYVDGNKKYYLAMKATDSNIGNYTAYLQEHR